MLGHMLGGIIMAYFIGLAVIILLVLKIVITGHYKLSQMILAVACADAIAFITISVLPVVFKLSGISYNDDMRLPVAGGYLIYVFLGYLISHHQIDRKLRIISYLLAVLGWAFHFFGTSALSLPAGRIVDTFKGYTNFPAILQAAGVFIAIRYFPWDRFRHVSCMLMKLSKYTFGVYLIHIYAVWGFPKVIGFSSDSIIWRTVGALAVFILCEAMCLCMSKVPVIRKTIGI